MTVTGSRDECPVAESAAGVVRQIAMVVAIAPTVDDRVQIAASVGDLVPVLMVASPREAVALLGGVDPQEALPPTAPQPTAPARTESVTTNDLTVDSDGRVLTCHGGSVTLSPLEHDLVTCLLGEVGHTWPYRVLHRRVWGNDHQGGRADVQSVVKRLRQKLGQIRSPLRLDVIRGVGLRLVPDHELAANCLPLPTPCPPASIAARRARS